MSAPTHDDEQPAPAGPIADFAAELHSQAESLRFDLPFALRLKTVPVQRGPQPMLMFVEDTAPTAKK